MHFVQFLHAGEQWLVTRKDADYWMEDVTQRVLMVSDTSMPRYTVCDDIDHMHVGVYYDLYFVENYLHLVNN